MMPEVCLKLRLGYMPELISELEPTRSTTTSGRTHIHYSHTSGLATRICFQRGSQNFSPILVKQDLHIFVTAGSEVSRAQCCHQFIVSVIPGTGSRNRARVHHVAYSYDEWGILNNILVKLRRESAPVQTHACELRLKLFQCGPSK
jgi:hypothetical protein